MSPHGEPPVETEASGATGSAVPGTPEAPGTSSAPAATVAALLLARAGDDHPGLRAEDGVWSWREVVQASASRGALLVERRNDGPFHVGVLLANVPEYVWWLGAAALVGAVVVGINPTRRGEALAEDIRRTDCQLLVTDADGAALLDGLDLGPGLGPDRVLRVDQPGYHALLDEHGQADARSLVAAGGPTAEQLYLLLFTSGTTGAPKAVRCSQGRLASIATTAASAYGFGRHDVAYCMMPLFHGNALMVLWGPAMVVGATVALAKRFSASGFGDDVRRYGVTRFTYVGKALSYILATPVRPDDATTTLRRGFGTEASVADHAAFEARFGCVLTEGYGASEGGASINRMPGTPAGSLGKPAGDVAVVDPTSLAECPPARFDAAGRLVNGEQAVGEIVNRSGTGSFEGYYDDPAASEARTRNGWYWTGDLAYRDADGFFYFAGRRGDWLRVDSENLTAGPIERVLVRYPGTAAVAVYGVPDTRSGDQVMAALELFPGTEFEADRFTAFLESQPDLGTKWAPRFVRATRALPQTATGRVRKDPLRAEGWWATDDPVFWRPAGLAPGAALRYRPLTDDDRRALRGELARHGREGLAGG